MSVGMGIDLAQVLAQPMLIVVSVVGLFLLKGGLARAFGYSPAQSVEIGLTLGQGGEFAFVVIGMALSLALLPQDTAQFMLIVVSMTMFFTPLVVRGARSLASAVERASPGLGRTSIDVPADLSGHVVIVGFGRTGQLLAEILGTQSIAHVALDMHSQQGWLSTGRHRLCLKYSNLGYNWVPSRWKRQASRNMAPENWLMRDANLRRMTPLNSK